MDENEGKVSLFINKSYTYSKKFDKILYSNTSISDELRTWLLTIIELYKLRVIC